MVDPRLPRSPSNPWPNFDADASRAFDILNRWFKSLGRGWTAYDIPYMYVRRMCVGELIGQFVERSPTNDFFYFLRMNGVTLYDIDRLRIAMWGSDFRQRVNWAGPLNAAMSEGYYDLEYYSMDRRCWYPTPEGIAETAEELNAEQREFDRRAEALARFVETPARGLNGSRRRTPAEIQAFIDGGFRSEFRVTASRPNDYMNFMLYGIGGEDV